MYVCASVVKAAIKQLTAHFECCCAVLLLMWVLRLRTACGMRQVMCHYEPNTTLTIYVYTHIYRERYLLKICMKSKQFPRSRRTGISNGPIDKAGKNAQHMQRALPIKCEKLSD